MKNQTCCFIGHSAISKKEYESIEYLFENEIVELINQGVYCFNTGAALGFDMLAAQTVLRLKETYPFIILDAVLHHKNNPTKGWSEKNAKKIQPYP